MTSSKLLRGAVSYLKWCSRDSWEKTSQLPITSTLQMEQLSVRWLSIDVCVKNTTVSKGYTKRIITLIICFSCNYAGGEDFSYMPSMPYVTFVSDNLTERAMQFTINFLDDMIIEGNQTFNVSLLGTNSSIEFTIIDDSSK